MKINLSFSPGFSLGVSARFLEIESPVSALESMKPLKRFTDIGQYLYPKLKLGENQKLNPALVGFALYASRWSDKNNL